MTIADDRLKEFRAMFDEFVHSFLESDDGIEHMSQYPELRAQGRKNYHEVLSRAERGEDITEEVLLKFLPYTGSRSNREKGAWVHLASVIRGDLRKWFERTGWADPSDWPAIAQAIFRFVRRSVEHPEELRDACEEFANSPYSRGFQSAFLSPILNAQRPDDFYLVNSKPLKVLDFLTGARHSSGIREYPDVNSDLHSVVEELTPVMEELYQGDARPADLFDAFSHWFVETGQPNLYRVPDNERKGDHVSGGPGSGEPAFSNTTFDLMERLHETPTRAFYRKHREDFREFVEKPFRDLFKLVAQKLPPAITEVMETEKRNFSRILKNDYGRGGTWDFYWGAFYPKEGKRSSEVQLAMGLYPWFLHAGFYIGDYSPGRKRLFVKNCKRHLDELKALLGGILSDGSLVYGFSRAVLSEENENNLPLTQGTWQEFLENPEDFAFSVSVIFPKRRLLEISKEALADQIAEIHKKLFPLVLLSMREDPLEEISNYLHYIGLTPSAPYTREDFIKETLLTSEKADAIMALLQSKKQIILYGPPGTGKTFTAQKLAQWLIGESEPSDDRVSIIQFHPSYAYEDFMEGIRPKSEKTDDGKHVIDYPVESGVFVKFCQAAVRQPDKRHVFIIDEINRGNISRIFGELMFLLEYRDRSIRLPYSGERFSVPDNVFLIGTMNTADRSIALVDFALRRRFHFVRFDADPDMLDRWLASHPSQVPYLSELYRALLEVIEDPDFAIGPSHFMKPDLTEEDLRLVWKYSIEPYLEEYFVEQPSKVAPWRWDGQEVRRIREPEK